MKRFGIVVLAGSVIGAVVLAWLWWQAGQVGDATLAVSVESKAKSLLEDLGLPEGANALSEISVAGPDGPMPEIASRSYDVQGSPASLKAFYVERCRRSGLGSPGSDVQGLEPAAICEGRGSYGSVVVLLYPKCEQSDCKVNVEVRLSVI